MTKQELQLLSLIIHERLIRCFDLYGENYDKYTIVSIEKEFSTKWEIVVEAYDNNDVEAYEYFEVDVSFVDIENLKKLMNVE